MSKPCTLQPVKWIRLTMVLCVLGLWLGATNHCRLEQLPGLEFLQCASDSVTESDCSNGEDACAAIEKGAYKTERSKVAPAGPLLLVALLGPNACRLQTPIATALVDSPLLSSPELSVTWQFSLRTALSPRAPSIVS